MIPPIPSRNEFPTLIDHFGFKRAIEVGVWEGSFSSHLLQHSKLDELVSLDPWIVFHHTEPTTPAHREALARAALMPFGARSQVLKESSPHAATQFLDGYFDFAYIDGSHRYRAVRNDINAWWPKVRIGGVLAGHDYNRGRQCNVIPAVNEFISKNNCVLHLTLNDPYPSWWILKGQ